MGSYFPLSEAAKHAPPEFGAPASNSTNCKREHRAAKNKYEDPSPNASFESNSYDASLAPLPNSYDASSGFLPNGHDDGSKEASRCFRFSSSILTLASSA